MKEREILEIGDLTVDPGARRVTRGDVELPLGRLSFDLLVALVRAAPAAISNDDIVRVVWSGDVVSDETVKQRVSLLRRGLGQSPGREYVETLRGFGYRLGMPLESAGEAEPVAPDPEPALGRWAKIVILILVIISLILVIAVLATAVRQVKRMSDHELGNEVTGYSFPAAAPGLGRE